MSATGGRRLAVAACAVAGAAVTGLLALAVTLAGDGRADAGTVRVVVERPAITTPVPDAAPSDAPATQRVRVATEPPAARATAAVARPAHRTDGAQDGGGTPVADPAPASVRPRPPRARPAPVAHPPRPVAAPVAAPAVVVAVDPLPPTAAADPLPPVVAPGTPDPQAPPVAEPPPAVDPPLVDPPAGPGPGVVEPPEVKEPPDVVDPPEVKNPPGGKNPPGVKNPPAADPTAQQGAGEPGRPSPADTGGRDRDSGGPPAAPGGPAPAGGCGAR